MRKSLTAPIGAMVALATAGVLVLAPATGATADPINFPAQAPVEYGTYWSIQTKAAPTYNYYGSQQYQAIVKMNNAPSGYQPTARVFPSAETNISTLIIYPQEEVRPLNAGDYTFDVAVTSSTTSDTIVAGTTKPQPFTISPAALGIEARIVADTANPADAIVSARFTGDFAETFVTTQYPGAPFTPSGSWKVSVTDSDGEVTDWAADRTADDDVMAVSFLWADAEPGEVYSVKAEFDPTGDAAKNFTVAASSDFSFTAPKADREFGASDAPVPEALKPPEVAAFSVPIWWLALAGVLVLALGSLLIIQAVRLRRPTSTTQQTGTAHA